MLIARRVCAAALVLSACGRVGFDDQLELCDDDDAENNDTAGTAATVSSPETSWRLCPGDEDWMRVPLAAGDATSIEVVHDPSVVPLEVSVEHDGGVVTDARLDLDAARITVRATSSAGTALIRVRGIASAGGIAYTLRLSEPAETRIYIAANGDDAGTGSLDAPYRTFARAIPELAPGRTLVVLDGTYTAGDQGPLSASCTGGAPNGSPDAPIRVVAAHERRARIVSDGLVPAVRIFGCRDWTIEGLQAESIDATGFSSDGFSAGNAVLVSQSQRVTFRRLIAAHSNRFANAALYLAVNSTDVLVEECEAYFFHRAAFMTWDSTRATLRRCYAHSRAYADLATGSPLHPSGAPSPGAGLATDPSDRGDQGFRIGPGSGDLVESSIDERNGAFTIAPNTGVTVDTRVAGTISLDSITGFTWGFAVPTDTNARTALVDCAAVRPELDGYFSYGVEDASCTSCTAIGAGGDGFRLGADGAVRSFRCAGCLAIGNARTGFTTLPGSVVTLDTRNSFDNGDLDVLATDTLDQQAASIDPGMLGCSVVLPSGSPMHGLGPSGIDVGAHIAYRYVDGVRSSVPLWAPSDGRFPCGAVVAGLNDLRDESCTGVHERVGIGTPSCPLP